ncbi:MAG: ribosome maturation factor RimM [Desulforegulaceae bacterium]|jgi:16S rRNA processing protein RimM|nr:ribosome maturation factor RimM [Desulforegulaceae bacterium]
MDSDYILVGRISGAHGLKGLVTVHSYAENHDLFGAGSNFYIKKKDCSEFDFFESLNFSIKKNSSLIVAFKGIEGRDQAEALKGRDVYIKKNSLPTPEDDSFYWHDLIGMNVIDLEKGEIGRVKNIMRTGSSDILEVKTKTGEVLVPFLKNVIVSVSIKDNIIKVSLPEGLLDL